MKITSKKITDYLHIYVEGRLDASWADFFTDSLFDMIRNGDHKLILHCEELEFLSSAGIRSLLIINKELAKVHGSFSMYGANDFVSGTIRTTGFGEWLIENLPDTDISQDKAKDHQEEKAFLIHADGNVRLMISGNWKPWDKLESNPGSTIKFSSQSFALGIGAPAAQKRAQNPQFGDFMVVNGHVIYQPPEEKSRPDYLLPLEEFFPEMLTIQSLTAEGRMQWLYRFSPDDQNPVFPISALASKALELTQADCAVFVIIGETDGLVGANLIQSPAFLSGDEKKEFPELRNWLSFSGEKVQAGEQSLIFGVVSKEKTGTSFELLKKIPGEEGHYAHVHAAVFPYQPLQNGLIDLEQQVRKFFNGPPPKAMMHLINDDRLTIGLGESELVRGALWCAPVKEMEGSL